ATAPISEAPIPVLRMSICAWVSIEVPSAGWRRAVWLRGRSDGCAAARRRRRSRWCGGGGRSAGRRGRLASASLDLLRGDLVGRNLAGDQPLHRCVIELGGHRGAVDKQRDKAADLCGEVQPCL